MTLPLFTRVVPGTSPLTAVILRIPSASIVTPGGQAVVLTTYHGPLTVMVPVAVSSVFLTGRVRSAAVLSPPTGPGQSLRCCHLHHDPLLSPIASVRSRILQECQFRQLTQLRHIVKAEGVAFSIARVLIMKTPMSTSNVTLGLQRIIGLNI